MTMNGAAAVAPASSRDAPFPGARLALLLLLTINLFNYIDRQVLAANVPSIEWQLLPRKHGYAAPAGAGIGVAAAIEAEKLPANPDATANKSKLGDLAFAFMFSYIVLAPLFAWLADRMSRWQIVAIGLVLWSLASGASGLPGTFGHAADSSALALLVGTFSFLILTRCFVGVGEAAYGPVAPSVISDLYPVSRRGSILSWFYAAIPVGSALGYVLGGVAGWPWSFYLVVPPGLLLGAWCLFMPEPKRGQADLSGAAPTRHVGLKDYFLLLKIPSFVIDTLGMTALTFALGGIGYWMPDYINTTRKQPDLDRINTIFGAIVVVSGLGATLLGGFVGDKLRPYFSGSYFLVSATAMLLAFPLLIAALFVTFPWAWIFIFLTCFFLFFNTGPTNTILANVTHPSLRAPAFAFNILIIHILGDAFSPKIIGEIARFTATNNVPNMNAGFLAVSAMVLLGGVIWLIGIPFLARDTARAPHQLDEEKQTNVMQ
jgi:MFS family permease